MRHRPYPYIVVAFLTCQALFAQHVHPMSSPGTGPGGLPVTVDGSKNPQNIPDVLAYSHFFTAFAAHPNPTVQEQGRQNAQFTSLQLVAADSAALIGLLANLRMQLDQLESAFTAATPATAPNALASLQAQKGALVASTRANLQQSLTPAGVSRVDQYVQTRVKTHIVIYGGTM